MDVIRLVLDFEDRNLNRYLGYPCPSRQSPAVARRIAELGPRARASLHPKGTFRFVSLKHGAPAGFPGEGTVVGLGVSTIGSELDELIEQATGRGDFLASLILDAMGSAAAEAAADALDGRMRAQARQDGLHGAQRISPGYGTWSVLDQSSLLALLPAADIGVGLTPMGMMVPRKSVNFGVAFRDRPYPQASSNNRCDRCSLVRCSHRRRPEPELGDARLVELGPEQ